MLLGTRDIQCGELQCCRYSADTLAYCGNHTTCQNSHGSFSCPCVGGYQVTGNIIMKIRINESFPPKSFVADVGCSDINECTQAGWNEKIWHYCRCVDT